MASATQIQALATGADNEIRMILLGRTGTGKSSLGNTILGGRRFAPGISQNGVTTKCATGSRQFENKSLFLVDTPGFLDPSITEEDIQLEVGKSYELTAFPGPNVFLLVFEPGRMMPHEKESIQYLKKIFGPQSVNHTIVIFTHGDDLEEAETTIQEYLSKSSADGALKNILTECGDRFVLFNNKDSRQKKDETVKTLLQMIADMTPHSSNKAYTTETFAAVARAIAKEKIKGTFDPLKSDGSYTLLSQTKEIVIDGHLRRAVGIRRN